MLDEARRMVVANQTLTIEDAMKQVTKITPVSASLIEFMETQFEAESRQQAENEQSQSTDSLTT